MTSIGGSDGTNIGESLALMRNRWVCIRLDALGGLFVALLAAYLVYGNTNATASGTGFSLAMAGMCRDVLRRHSPSDAPS